VTAVAQSERKTPMRRGAVGWFIACRCCGREFESRGLAFCESCMALPAEERRKPLHGRPARCPAAWPRYHRAADRMRGIASTIQPAEMALGSYFRAKNTRLRAKFLSKIKGRFSAQKFGRSTSSAVIDAPTISPSTPRSWGQSCNARSPHDADHPGRSRALAARPDRVRSRGLDRSRNGPALRKAQGPRRRGALPAGPFFMDGKFIVSFPSCAGAGGHVIRLPRHLVAIAPTVGLLPAGMVAPFRTRSIYPARRR
jgi:hypothetical protein